MVDQKLMRQIESIQETTLAARKRIEKLRDAADRLQKNGRKAAAQKKRDETDALKDQLASGLEKAVLDLKLPALAVNALKSAVKKL
jgi:hypothetical protein